MMNYELVAFGEKEKKLLFDFNALALFDETYGESLISVMQEIDKNIGFRMIKTLYYAGLKNGRDAGMTQDLVGKLLYKKMMDEDLALEDLIKPIFRALDKGGMFKGVKFSEIEEIEEKN